MRLRFSLTPPIAAIKIKANDESQGRLKGYELDDGKSLCWRSARERACRPTKFPRFALNILFSLPATFIPLPESMYRRLGRQSIIRRRSSRDSTADRKLSRSLICSAPVGSSCRCRSKDRNCLRLSSRYLGQIYFDLTLVKIAYVRRRHLDMNRVNRPILQFSLLFYSLFFLNKIPRLVINLWCNSSIEARFYSPRTS